MHGGHILTVADEGEIGGHVVAALARRRAVVTSVATLEQAAAALAAGPPAHHMVIVRLGKEVDADTATVFAANVRARRSPELLLLALLSDPRRDADRLIQAGFDDAMAEPRHAVQFEDRLAALFRLATMRRELGRRIATARRFNDGEELASEGLDFAPSPTDSPIGQPRILACTFGTDSPVVADIRRQLGVITGARWFADPADAQAELFRQPFDLCLLVVEDEPERALQFARLLRRSASLFNMSLLLVTPEPATVDLDLAFKAGVGDVTSPAELPDALEAHLASVGRLERLRRHLVAAYRQPAATSIQDMTTGLYARAFAMEHLALTIAANEEQQMPLSLGLLSLDSLRQVNHDHGYHAGDFLLRQIGETIRRCLRGEDMGARVGGAQILLIFPDTPLASARVAMGRLTSILRHTAFLLPGGAGSPAVDISHAVIGWGHAQSAKDLLDMLRLEIVGPIAGR